MAYIRGGGAGAEKPTLLWTNPNPGSSFSAKTITLDVSTYEDFLIVFKHDTSSNNMDTFCQKKSVSFSHYIGVGMSDGSYRIRGVSRSSTGLYFASCINAQGTNYNNIIIPYQIYGIKKSLT